MKTDTLPATRPFYWSLRREVWENRSVYLALLVAAGLGLLAFCVGLAHTHHALRDDGPFDLIMPYSHLSMLVVLAEFLVGIFYSLDALHSERSERSIFFWKSLPVSDRTTVLAKAAIPLLVLPALAFLITVAAQMVMLLLHLVEVLGSGLSVAGFWHQLPLFQMQLVLFYALAVMVLWHAPIYGWLLLVSGWARRGVFLWAFLPPLAVGLFEFFAFHTTNILGILEQRLFGFAAVAFTVTLPGGGTIDPHLVLLEQLSPVSYLRSPGLWIGLVTAAVLIAAAIRLRRYREPV